MSTLTSLLARDAIVSVDAIEEALQREVLEGGEIDTALLELDAADENVLASYRAASFQLEPATREELMQAQVEALASITAEVARKLSIVPLHRADGRLIVGAFEPPKATELARLAEQLGLELEVRVGTEVRVSAALARHYDIEPSSRLRRLADQLDSRAAGDLTDVAPPSDVPPTPAGANLPPPARLPSDLGGAGGGSGPEVLPVRVVQVVALGAAPLDDGVDVRRKALQRHDAPAPGTDDDTRPARPSKLPPGPTGVAATARVSAPGSASSRPRSSGIPHGPLTRGAVVELLERAHGRDEVLELLFAFARQYFECTALFSLREGHLLGLEASGLRSAVDPRTVDVSFDRDGTVHDAVMSQRPRVVDLSRLRADQPLVDALGRDGLQPAALIPVAIRKRIVALLYGDREGQRFQLHELADLIELLPAVTRAFERIIQEHKLLVLQARRRREPGASIVPTGSFAASESPRSTSSPAAADGSSVGSRLPTPTRDGVRPVSPATATGLTPDLPPASAQQRAETREGGPPTNPGLRPVHVDTDTGLAVTDPARPGSPEGPRNREVRLSRVDEPFRRSHIGERLAQNALDSLGVRGSAPAPPGGETAANLAAGDVGDLESRPTVTLSSTHVLNSAPPSVERRAGSYSRSTRPGPRPGAREVRDITRPVRRSAASPADIRGDARVAPMDGGDDGDDGDNGDNGVSRPPPRTLSQSPPGLGSYNVREVDTELVSLPGEGKNRRASRPAPARAPAERAAPRNSERPPGPPGSGAEDSLTGGAAAPEPHSDARPPSAEAKARARREEDPKKTAPARPSRRADPRREDGEGAAPTTETVSISPAVRESLLPPPLADDGGPQEMIIDLGSEASRLVEELARCAPDDEGPLVAALLRLGEPALEALTRRFPGGLWFNRNQAHRRLPAGRDVSAVARALYAFEERAAPHIARLLQSSRADVRLYAILLAVERVLPELLWPLYERVFDSDGGVRLLMYEQLPLYRNVEGFGDVLDALRARAADEGDKLPNRLAALEALAVLRDPRSLELLWELSRHDSRQLSVPAARALTTLTGQDFGTSARKWRNWISKNRGRHRAQWLIESLTHSEERVRAAAGHELQKLTQVYYGYSAAASKLEREKAKRRYEAWWETTGRTQFG